MALRPSEASIIHSTDLFEFPSQKIDKGADLGRRARAAGKYRMHVDRRDLVREKQRHRAPALISASTITVEAIAIPSPAITLANTPGPELLPVLDRVRASKAA
jgi:hypothetical protein